jgi:ribosomal protein S18 acetylase RimI-like enzyme
VSLVARPATQADLPELTSLQAAEDRHWFGSPEHDEAEVREAVLRAEPLGERSRVLHAGARLVAAGWWWRSDEATLLADESADVAAVYDDLLPWLVRSGVTRLEALRQDDRRRAALTRHAWQYLLSQFEMDRDTTQLPPPRWPAEVTITDLADHANAAYRVIYDEAGWASVPGHGAREFAEWHRLFVTDEDPQQQVLAWLNGRLVGVAVTTVFSDQMGWVGQLAVARDLQRNGLGTALLAEALHRLVAGGATRLGLGVSAANPDALRLYERLGFVIDREWQFFAPHDDVGRTREGTPPH